MGKREAGDDVVGGMLPVTEEMLAKIMGAGRKPEPTREERVAEARRVFADLVERVGVPCDDDVHQRQHVAAEALMRATFDVGLLPERLATPLLRAYVSLRLHKPGNGAQGVEALFKDDGREFADAMILTAVIAEACGVRVAAERERDASGVRPEAERVPGLYL